MSMISADCLTISAMLADCTPEVFWFEEVTRLLEGYQDEYEPQHADADWLYHSSERIYMPALAHRIDRAQALGACKLKTDVRARLTAATRFGPIGPRAELLSSQVSEARPFTAVNVA